MNIERHDHPEFQDSPVHYNESLREHYFVIKDDGEMRVTQVINYCPICGERFPPSFRNLWFDKLEDMGIDPLRDPVPDEFRTSKWREGLNL